MTAALVVLAQYSLSPTMERMKGFFKKDRKKSPKPPRRLATPGNSVNVFPQLSGFRAGLDAGPEGGWGRYRNSS